MLFLAQAFGVNLSLGQQLVAIGVLLLTSKGMAGVPGSAFLALSATATALGIFPVSGVALLLGADRIMDSMRVFVNLLGNCVATFVVSNWEGDLDHEQMRRVFAADRAARRGETAPAVVGDVRETA
nr:cation:dicarboxylase symporter family transporter [Bifidobacterium santillanense]